MADWTPAIASTSLFAAALWLARGLISARLTKSVEHEFDQKIELIKADIRAKETEIATLRSGALSALASRQVAVDQRRLEAIDQLWAAAISLYPARAISQWMSVVNFENAAEAAEKDEKARQLFATFGQDFDPKSINSADAQRARPYVSPMAWATYSVLLSLSVHAVMRWQILKGGLGKKDFADTESINKMLKTVLPTHVEYIDQYGPSGYHYLLDTLDKKLLDELQEMLVGVESDKANLEQAAEIIKQSNEILDSAAGA